MSQDERRDSKTSLVVDEDRGSPTLLVESFRPLEDGGPLASSDPRSLFLSMSEYEDKANYDVYGKFAGNPPQHVMVEHVP